jgi:hypothetical protein
MNNQTEIANLLRSYVEYRADFREPVLEVWNYGEFNAAVFRAFRQWNIGLADITWNPNPTNAAEIQSKFELLKGRYVFTVGYGSTGLSVVDPFWEEAEQIGEVIRAGNAAVLSVTKAEISHQSVQMSFHLKPRSGNLSDLTSEFINPLFSSALGETIRARGFSLYTDNRVWVVDLSVLDPNALYVRLARTFAPSVAIEQIVEALAADQAKLLEMLKLEIAENGE